MPVIKARSIQELKARVNIADVVSRTVALKKAGGNRFKGLCPFHNEKTPSFHVSTDKGFYKCFGCGKAGDILSFVMETEGLQFTEAAETLAKRFGVTLEYEEGGPTREERSLRQELFDIHDVAADHYRQAFLAAGAHGGFIRDYWVNQRRFPLELAEEFKIGFAPPEDGGLAAALLKKKFSEGAVRQCGLFFVREGAVLTPGALRPRFRGRLMIPIRDHQGRVVAFTARQLELTPADDPAREAKYVNSPETPVFTKSHLLFNLDRARTHVGDGHPFVLVEGQLDALRCWSAGLKTAVAPQGTSITEGQLALMRRYHPQVECFFDSDTAGQKAALRFLPLALKAGLEVRFLMLAGAEKLDPDLLFLERGLAAYAEVRKHSLSAMQFITRYILPDAANASAEEISRAMTQIYEIVAVVESAVLRRQLLEEIAPATRRLMLLPPDATIERDFEAFLARQAGSRFSTVPTASSASSRLEEPSLSHEYHLLHICYYHPEFLIPISQSVPSEWIDSSTASGKLLNHLLSEVHFNGLMNIAQFAGLLEDTNEKQVWGSIINGPTRVDNPEKIAERDATERIANIALQQLQRRFLEPQLRQIELEIASKGTIGDASLFPLLKRRANLTRQLLNPPKLTLAP